MELTKDDLIINHVYSGKREKLCGFYGHINDFQEMVKAGTACKLCLKLFLDKNPAKDNWKDVDSTPTSGKASK